MKFLQIENFCVVVFFAISLPVSAAPPELESDSAMATAGYFQLTWKQPGDVSNETEYILEEASEPEFSGAKILYRGRDTARHVSGRSDGTYYFRVRNTLDTDSTESWSNVTKVEVSHHPLSKAFTFFALGAVVFVATLVVVITGNKSGKQ